MRELLGWRGCCSELQWDDLLIVPGLFWLALKLIPEEILEQARLSVQTAGNERLEGDETAF